MDSLTCPPLPANRRRLVYHQQRTLNRNTPNGENVPLSDTLCFPANPFVSCQTVSLACYLHLTIGRVSVRVISDIVPLPPAVFCRSIMTRPFIVLGLSALQSKSYSVAFIPLTVAGLVNVHVSSQKSIELPSKGINRSWQPASPLSRQ